MRVRDLVPRHHSCAIYYTQQHLIHLHVSTSTTGHRNEPLDVFIRHKAGRASYLPKQRAQKASIIHSFGEEGVARFSFKCPGQILERNSSSWITRKQRPCLDDCLYSCREALVASFLGVKCTSMTHFPLSLFLSLFLSLPCISSSKL